MMESESEITKSEEKIEDFVNVSIRIRPHTSEDTSLLNPLQVISHDPAVLYVAERQQSYSFDNIFTDISEQEEVYDKIVKPLVNHVLDGYNSTVFAYGQTGTGKTYTMGSNPEKYSVDAGLITRTLNDIFDQNQNKENKEISINVSFFEIYNEKVYDLLSNNKTALQVKGFKINGLTKLPVANCADAQSLLYVGGKNRHTGETKQNLNSSRSHAIFTIYCIVKDSNNQTEAKLNLVDLAGSESVKKTGNEGSVFHEGVNINKGLLYIGQVINALSCNQTFVPYRQSTITTILQDSLNKNNFVTLIACIGSHIEDLHETVQTLDFAQRAKRLKSKPEVNNIILEYTKSNNLLGSIRKSKVPTQKVIPRSAKKEIPLRRPLFTSTIMKRPRPPANSTLLSVAESRDLFSMSLSSSVSTINDGMQNLSPIIKKCIDAVENNILQKLESIVRDSMITPAKQKTPNICWSKLQTEVTKIVRTEFDQLSDHRSCYTFRGHGGNGDEDISLRSAGNEEQIQAPKRYLDFNNESPIMKTCNYPENERDGINFIFKEPKPMPRKRIKLKSSSPKTSSPMKSPKYNIPETPTRRSVRLSAKDCSSYYTRLNISLREIASKPRRSTRINEHEETFKMPVPTPRGNRKSLKRLTMQPAIPSKTPKRAKVQIMNKSSKAFGDKKHTEVVLKILNSGTESEIMKLSTIGAKVASMLLCFRQLKGPFERVKDLENMPWRGNGYRRFISENFLLE